MYLYGRPKDSEQSPTWCSRSTWAASYLNEMCGAILHEQDRSYICCVHLTWLSIRFLKSFTRPSRDAAAMLTLKGCHALEVTLEGQGPGHRGALKHLGRGQRRGRSLGGRRTLTRSAQTLEVRHFKSDRCDFLPKKSGNGSQNVSGLVLSTLA
jgi:hypothetical protein